MMDVRHKSSKEADRPKAVPKKVVRNFQIIDDDIDIHQLNPSEDAEALVDLLDPEGPVVADIGDFEARQLITVKEVRKDNKWVKVCQDSDGDFVIAEQREATDSPLEKIRKIEPPKVEREVPLEEIPVFRRSKKATKEDEIKKAREAEKLEKYMEWGKGLVQQKKQKDKMADAMHEVDKPLARYKDDDDLESMLKKQEREDDPMAEYLRNKTAEETGGIEVKKVGKYRGPPPPPNRYNLMPGSRWDGVDRSNGFEKKYYDSLTAKKARDHEAFMWSVEDM